MNNRRDHANLNQISHDAALALAREALDKGFKVTHIYADTVGDPQKYANYLRTNLAMHAQVL